MKKCIVVLGAHRSGTSALMGALYRMGVNIGSNYLVDHYENSHFVNFDTSLLEMVDSAWDDVFMLPDQWWMDKHLDSAKNELSDILRKEFGEHQLWGIKDPRICRLLPFWLDVFNALNVEPVFLIPLRDPFEVVRSHEKRDNFPVEKILLIWMNHVFSAEYHSRGYLRCFCRFNDLLKAPEETLLRFSRLLHISFPRPFESGLKDVLDYLKPDLKHHNIQMNGSWDDYPEPFEHLYKFLFSRSVSLAEIDRAHDTWDDCRKGYGKLLNFFLNNVIRDDWIELKNSHSRLLHLTIETGLQMIKNRQFDFAIDMFAGALSILPEHRGLLNNLGVAYENKGDLDQALKYYQKAIEHSPGYQLARDNYDRVQKKRGH